MKPPESSKQFSPMHVRRFWNLVILQQLALGIRVAFPTMAIRFFRRVQNVSAIAVFRKRPGFLERLFSLFAPIHRGEGLTALLLMLNVFTLLTAYYIIKPV